MNFSLLFEGPIHHFDMLRFLSGGDCETLMGFGWNPEWSSSEFTISTTNFTEVWDKIRSHNRKNIEVSGW